MLIAMKTKRKYSFVLVVVVIKRRQRQTADRRKRMAEEFQKVAQNPELYDYIRELELTGDHEHLFDLAKCVQQKALQCRCVDEKEVTRAHRGMSMDELKKVILATCVCGVAKDPSSCAYRPVLKNVSSCCSPTKTSSSCGAPKKKKGGPTCTKADLKYGCAAPLLQQEEQKCFEFDVLDPKVIAGPLIMARQVIDDPKCRAARGCRRKGIEWSTKIKCPTPSTTDVKVERCHDGGCTFKWNCHCANEEELAELVDVVERTKRLSLKEGKLVRLP